jgi:hypothetical protein
MMMVQRSRIVRGWTFDALLGVLTTDLERVFRTDHIRADIGGVEVGHAVRCLVGKPAGVMRVLTIPLEIHSDPDSRWFPRLDAEIEIRPVSNGVEIAVEGEYTVPVGPLGWIADHTLLHGVAASSLDRYLEDVEERLEQIALALEPLTGVPI